MIIIKLFEFSFFLFDKITSFMNIPPLSSNIVDMINTVFDYIMVGAGILSNYTPFGYLLILLGIVISVDIGITIYYFVMWILKKIPMAAIT